MKKLIIAAGVIALAGCASRGYVIPKPDGVYEIQAAGYTSNEAMQTALNFAADTCKPKRYEVIEQLSGYRGAYSEQTRDALNEQRAAFAAATRTFVMPVNGSSDYRTALRIKCVDK